jgi:iron complex outermembrane receptor protein
MLNNKCLLSIFILLAFICQGNILYAQQGSIKGQVSGLSDDDLPVVNLLRAADSSLVKTNICEPGGKFDFNSLKDDTYFISIMHLGYQLYTTSIITLAEGNREVQTPVISLQRSITELKEVEVAAKLPFVQRKIDRVVVNPDALIGNAGKTALEVMEKAPGVTVDLNGNISLKGKQGVVVFIDNKPTYMGADDLANYLRSLPASQVSSIELMTTPPAGYDAAGNAGIINIKLKKNTEIGMSGGINLSYGQGRYYRTNNSFNINYRVNKINLFASGGISQNNSYQDLTINRYYYTPDGVYNSGFTQNNYIKQQHGGKNARIGFDHYMSKASTFGIVFSGAMNPSNVPSTNNAEVSDAQHQTVSLVNALTTSERVWKSGSANANYALKVDDKGKELSANADYIAYSGTHNQQLVNTTYTPEKVFVAQTTLNSNLPADITIKSIKVDYANPFTNGSKIDVGLKSSLVNTENTASFFDVVNGVETPNYTFSNQFNYKENINAGYLNYSRDWTKFSIQMGLRVENTNLTGDQLGNVLVKDSVFTRQYTSLFPTLYLAYRLDSAQVHQFGFSFGRRINRPSYEDLNPFTYPMDRYTYYAGNPFLQPTYSYNFELSHTYKNQITTTFEYSLTKNLISETNEQRANIYYSRPGNFGQQTIYGFTINGNIQLAKWWTFMIYSEAKNVSYNTTIYGQPLKDSKWYWWVGPTNQFAITKKLTAELAGTYQTRILSGQFLIISVWQMSCGLSQQLFKGKGSVRLNLSDMFYTNQPGGDIRNIANSKANWLSYLDTRVATISFSYRFNKGKSLAARKSGASDTEKERVKM